MTKFELLTLPLAFAFALAGGSALADGDATAGKKVFNKCKACHALEAGKKKIGPSLHGVFGRKAGSVTDYGYSDAVRMSPVVWTAETLDRWLENPQELIPGQPLPMYVRRAAKWYEASQPCSPRP